MSFTGKATYTGGVALPELTEDVADMVAIISPDEVPLLDALGDPLREATSTYHEWMEDEPGNRKERVRRGNYTQIFTATAEATAGNLGGTLGVADELDYQKQEKLRGLLRDLENSVINGGQLAADPQGSGTVRRTMKGIIQHLSTNVFTTGDSGFPAGNDLDESQVTAMLQQIWQNSSGNVDLIVVGGAQKRRFNKFHSGAVDERGEGFRPPVYESDFGICRIVTTRWLPQDAALFLDSSRISILPLAGRSFHFKPLASAGDYECGELIGEYTVELKQESCHGLITGLSTA